MKMVDNALSNSHRFPDVSIESTDRWTVDWPEYMEMLEYSQQH